MGVARVFRKTMMTAGVLGGLGLAAGAVLGYPLIGLGVVVGVGLGVVNAFGMRRMVTRAAATGEAVSKGAIAGASISRLGVVTVCVFVLLFLDQPVGVGSLAGLVLFQVALLANCSRIILRQLRREAGL
ncbi:MAG: hypothetical protein ACRDZQ_14905 [Acidimicrobiales bacterium]